MHGSDTPCKVIPLPNNLQRAGRAGVAAVPSGTTLYYLWHEDTGLYYAECYVNQAYAIQKAIVTTGPRSMSDVALSWCAEAKSCYHSWKTGD